MKHRFFNKPTKERVSTNQDADLSDLVFNICFSGSIPQEKKVGFLDHFQAFLIGLNSIVSSYATKACGFNSTAPVYHFFYNTESCNLIPTNVSNMNIKYVPIVAKQSQIRELTSEKVSPVYLGLSKVKTWNHVNSPSTWMLEQSDLLFTVWDGSREFQNGIVWENMLQAQKRGIPVVWMDSSDYSRLFVYENGKSSQYRENSLELYCQDLLEMDGSTIKKNKKRKKSDSNKPRKTFVSGLYKRFINNFKINQEPSSADELLEKDFRLQKFFISYPAKYEFLKKSQCIAGEAASIENDNYRSALLLKGLLPFIVNCILIFGFYAKTIGYMIPFSLQTWDIIITVSFSFQFVCQCLLIWVSDQNDHKGWQRQFITQRYIAEVLRLFIHFAPLNLPVNLTESVGFSENLANRSFIIRNLRRVFRKAGVNFSPIPKDEYKDFFFTQTFNLINDQITYHQNTAKKYRIIASRLTKLAQTLFWIGLGVVAARVALQGVYLKLDDVVDFSIKEYANLRAAISATANLFAMIVPSAASTVFIILSLCGFRDLGNRSEKMSQDLVHLKSIIEDESQRNDLYYEDYCHLANQVSYLLLDEISGWYSMINAKKITRN